MPVVLSCFLRCKKADRKKNYRHGKAQHEPAWQFVVLDHKLLPLHNTYHNLPAVCYVVTLAVSPNAKI